MADAGRVQSRHGSQRDAVPPVERHRHAKHRVCEETGCDVQLPSFDKHPEVVCRDHRMCRAWWL